ncbi:hypothetical protein H1P_1810016 [Hyella patelloides LEGE 07179]|uniref:Uncharacterized protein n=1 Tax=Hyella patelloides LEGE 07179 TaxID=945734 RepID=A0A563VNX6_9CYAN|nr:hypothetical protein H1P_1810016 [Hyella patelloides LEGE 07179]
MATAGVSYLQGEISSVKASHSQAKSAIVRITTQLPHNFLKF